MDTLLCRVSRCRMVSDCQVCSVRRVKAVRIICGSAVFLSAVAVSTSLPIVEQHAQASCEENSTLWIHAPNIIATLDVRSGDITTVSTASQTLFDIGVDQNGTVWGVTGAGDLMSVNRDTGALSPSKSISGVSFTNMLSFDKYGNGFVVASNELKRFSAADAAPTLTAVPKSIGVTATTILDGFAAGSTDLTGINPTGDSFFLGGDMYMSVSGPSGAKLIRIDMVDSGTEYVWDGIAVDLGYIGADGENIPGWGMGVVDGQIFIHKSGAPNAEVARIDALPTTSDKTRRIPVTVVKDTGWSSIYGMAGDDEALLDDCAPADPELPEQAIPTLVKDVDFTVVLNASAWPGSTFSITAGNLPDGLTLDTATGSISGRPTTAGSYDFTVTLTSPTGSTANQRFQNSVLESPGAPTEPEATAGDSNAQVSWIAPASLGGGTLTQYTVTASPGGQTCTTGETSCTVENLDNGTTYSFVVVATTEAGDSPASASSNSVTPMSATAPTAPESVSAAVSGTTATITWEAPSSNGGSAITGYTARATPGDKTCTTTGATTCDITELVEGESYTFTVTATNAIGTSSESSPSSAAQVPAAPTTTTPPTNTTPLSGQLPSTGLRTSPAIPLLLVAAGLLALLRRRSA